MMCLNHSAFTSKITHSILSRFSMWLQPSPYVKKVQVNARPYVVRFLRVLRFPPTGKVDRGVDYTESQELTYA